MSYDRVVPLATPLRSLLASTVALAVAASTGLALASTPAQPQVAIPAVQDAVALAELQASERQALIASRAAEREALQNALMLAVEERTISLASTSGAIDATEAALQQQRAEQAAAEKAAAEKAAAEKAAAEKKAVQKAAAEKTAAEKTAAEKAAAEKAAADKAAAEKKAPAVKGGSRADNKELGRQLASSLYGWGGEQFTCYDNIIMRESMWDQYADNPTSSAYGIPQALPGKRMASEGTDWATNPATQIKWGLKYVKERYGTPCKAWSFKRANGWY